MQKGQTKDHLGGLFKPFSTFSPPPTWGKRGEELEFPILKKQVVMGLLCDEEGRPLSAELFRGNTQDPKTFESQIAKATKRFGCKDVTFVGDRGMIKSGQIKALGKEHFHFITALTRPQIETMLFRGTLQLELFDETICEINSDDIRYLCRRNPIRAQEIAESRASKKENVIQMISNKNAYLKEHRGASIEIAMRDVNKKITNLNVFSWLSVFADGRELFLREDSESLREDSKLDGCYVIKTDLSTDQGSKEMIHHRYKDLALVEQAFRSSKTSHLELRPIYVRKEENTRGHALVVMLAYLIVRELQKNWVDFDMTVEEGLDRLKNICTTEVTTKDGGGYQQIPEPDKVTKELLHRLGISLPKFVKGAGVVVDTRKKLNSERKPH